MNPQEAEDAQVVARLQALGRHTESQLPYRWGFIVLAFPFGADGRMNYVSNAERHDVVRAMYEFIAASKGQWAEHEPEADSAAYDDQLGRARQRVAELEKAHEELLLKGAKDQNIALQSLDTALKRIAELEGLLEHLSTKTLPPPPLS